MCKVKRDLVQAADTDKIVHRFQRLERIAALYKIYYTRIVFASFC